MTSSELGTSDILEDISDVRSFLMLDQNSSTPNQNCFSLPKNVN